MLAHRQAHTVKDLFDNMFLSSALSTDETGRLNAVQNARVVHFLSSSNMSNAQRLRESEKLLKRRLVTLPSVPTQTPLTGAAIYYSTLLTTDSFFNEEGLRFFMAYLGSSKMSYQIALEHIKDTSQPDKSALLVQAFGHLINASLYFEKARSLDRGNTSHEEFIKSQISAKDAPNQAFFAQLHAQLLSELQELPRSNLNTPNQVLEKLIRFLTEWRNTDEQLISAWNNANTKVVTIQSDGKDKTRHAKDPAQPGVIYSRSFFGGGYTKSYSALSDDKKTQVDNGWEAFKLNYPDMYQEIETLKEQRSSLLSNGLEFFAQQATVPEGSGQLLTRPGSSLYPPPNIRSPIQLAEAVKAQSSP